MSLDVETILHSLDIEVIKDNGEELVAKCPGHLQRTGKEDKHPSWSINTRTYVHHCFSCGYGGTLTTLYRDVAGEVPDDLEWELSKQSVLGSLERTNDPVPASGPPISEWVLRRYTDVPERLLERRTINRASADHFGIRWDSEKKVWVIPIRTPDGELMGFQYRQKGIVLNHPPGMEKSTTLFGFHLFRHKTRITIVESPLDAVRLYNVGIAAVSSFGASVSWDQIELLSRNFRYIVAAMDFDAPGQRANEFLRNSLRARGCTVLDFDYTGLGVKDPGDIKSDEDLQNAWERSIMMRLNH